MLVQVWSAWCMPSQALQLGRQQTLAPSARPSAGARERAGTALGATLTQSAPALTCAGLFFDAASWDGTLHELAESRPKELFSAVPKMHFVPKKVTDFDNFAHYNCPMYKTSERRGVLSTTGHSTNFVMDVRVPTSRDASHWIKRGTAMLTSLDD